MMMARRGSLSHQAVDGFASPVATAAHRGFDAYDCPAILLGGDAGTASETRSVLQSLGFDVLAGLGLTDVDEVPVVVVLSNTMEEPATSRKLEKIRAIWPSAPAILISEPSDAAVQLRSLFS